MKSVDFPGCNVQLGKGQEEYFTLPAMHMQDEEGTIYTCWELSDEELEQVKKTKRVYVRNLTFNQGFSPINVMTDLSEGFTITEEDE